MKRRGNIGMPTLDKGLAKIIVRTYFLLIVSISGTSYVINSCKC